MLLKQWFLAISAALMLATSAIGHDNMEVKQDAINNERVRKAGGVCVAMIRRFVFPGQSYNDLFDTHGSICRPEGVRGEFSVTDQWRIVTTQISTIDEREFSEVEVRIIGPAEHLTNSTQGKFEDVTFRVITFYDADLKFRTITYFRRMRFNRRSFEELTKDTHKDNVVFDPENNPWKTFDQKVQDELRMLSCHMIARLGGAPPIDCEGLEI